MTSEIQRTSPDWRYGPRQQALVLISPPKAFQFTMLLFSLVRTEGSLPSGADTTDGGDGNGTTDSGGDGKLWIKEQDHPAAIVADVSIPPLQVPWGCFPCTIFVNGWVQPPFLFIAEGQLRIHATKT